jgi:hypothetical protein
MCWLVEKLGLERLLTAEVLLPTDDFFPFDYEGSPDDARRLMDYLGDCMGVNASGIPLEVLPDECMPGAAGHYDRDERGRVIRVAESQLTKPQNLLATLAHELAHEILLGGGRLTADMEDHEWITDLLLVYLSVGVFAANTALTENYETAGAWSWWRIGKQGYLPAHLFGYAMALFAYLREEEPVWAQHLRLDARAALQEGLHFLRKTNDSLCRPDVGCRPYASPTTADRIEILRHGSPTVRLATLWDIRAQPNLEPALEPALNECVTNREGAIAAEAIRALAAGGRIPGGSVSQLKHWLWHGQPAVRAAAAYALGLFRCEPAATVEELAAFLQDPDTLVRQEVCHALCRYGTAAAGAAPQVIQGLFPAFREGDELELQALLQVLLYTTPEPREVLRKHFGNPEDREPYHHFLTILEELADRQGTDSDSPAKKLA